VTHKPLTDEQKERRAHWERRLQSILMSGCVTVGILALQALYDISNRVSEYRPRLENIELTLPALSARLDAQDKRLRRLEMRTSPPRETNP
jgi:hypothetical protein